MIPVGAGLVLVLLVAGFFLLADLLLLVRRTIDFAAQSNLAFLGMWIELNRVYQAELLPFDADAGTPVMRLVQVQDTHSGGLLLVACRPLYEQSVPNSDVYLHRETIARIFFEAFHLFADSSDVRVRKLPRHSQPP